MHVGPGALLRFQSPTSLPTAAAATSHPVRAFTSLLPRLYSRGRWRSGSCIQRGWFLPFRLKHYCRSRHRRCRRCPTVALLAALVLVDDFTFTLIATCCVCPCLPLPLPRPGGAVCRSSCGVFQNGSRFRAVGTDGGEGKSALVRRHAFSVHSTG